MRAGLVVSIVAVTGCASAIPTLLRPAPAQTRHEPVVAVTDHVGTFNGETLGYRAIVSETLIPGADGAPAASMVTTTYLRRDTPSRNDRPVLFAFNGGPGASSTPLHLNAFGPRRYVTVDGERSMGDNPFSPLDAMDLVFIDPIGTGLSRPLPGVDGQPFWTVAGDAASVAAFIQTWLSEHGRQRSPRFLCGESYGTIRAARIVSGGADLSFDGILLLSMAGGPSGPDLPYVMLFPTYAATAAYHGEVDAAGRTPGEIFEGAAAFARSELLPALVQGALLPAAEKARLAAEMSSRIGLPAAFIADHDLRVDPPGFMLNLLKERGLRTGRLDTRATGLLRDYADKTPPYDDPSMLGPSGRPTRPVAHLYFVEELRFPTAETYIPLNLDVNSRWEFDVDPSRNDSPALVAGAMRRQPRLRLFWAAGYYDLATPLYSGKYLLDHAGVPPDRLVIAAFPTGHEVFEGDENLARFTQAVREFVTQTPTGSSALP